MINITEDMSELKMSLKNVLTHSEDLLQIFKFQVRGGLTPNETSQKLPPSPRQDLRKKQPQVYSPH